MIYFKILIAVHNFKAAHPIVIPLCLHGIADSHFCPYKHIYFPTVNSHLIIGLLFCWFLEWFEI